MIGHLLAEYGLFALFFGAGLEGEIAVVAGGIMAQRGLASLPAAMIVATLGSFTADQTWYFIGRYSRHSRFVARIRQQALFARALSLLDRHPVPFILGFRFVYGMRSVSPVAIGAAGIPIRLFLPLNMLAAVIWAPLFTWLGYHLGKAALPLLRRLSGVGLAVLGVAMLLGLVWWLWYRHRTVIAPDDLVTQRRLMERVTGGEQLPPHLRGGVIALGNFDGFHRGHQAVVGRAVARARARGVAAIVATFDPHPVRHFVPDAPPFRLTTLDQRQGLFAGAGADAMMVFDFGETLAGVTAEDFVRVWLAGASGVVTGEDFTFGKGRSGNIAVLTELGAQQGMSVDTVAAVTLDGAPVSSSRIRQALQAGDCAMAARLLTRPFAIEGVVQHGDALGRTIGYPTANLSLGSYLRPRYGVYAVRVRLADGRVVDGAANLGIRPQFEPPKELLEAYLFDFDEDLYGQVIEVSLIEHLRDEAKFDGIEALVVQMDADCVRARAILTPR